MKSKLLSILLGFATVLFFQACSGSGKEATEGGKNITKKSTNETISTIKGLADDLKTVQCNGTGEDYSGVYAFHWFEGKGSCTDNDGKTMNLPEYSYSFSCTQKNADFSCSAIKNANITIKGCISTQGIFKLEDDSDIGFLSKGVVFAGADSMEEKSIVVGEVGSDKGATVYGISGTIKGKKSKGCKMQWKFEAEKEKDAD